MGWGILPRFLPLASFVLAVVTAAESAAEQARRPDASKLRKRGAPYHVLSAAVRHDARAILRREDRPTVVVPSLLEGVETQSSGFDVASESREQLKGPAKSKAHVSKGFSVVSEVQKEVEPGKEQPRKEAPGYTQDRQRDKILAKLRADAHARSLVQSQFDSDETALESMKRELALSQIKDTDAEKEADIAERREKSLVGDIASVEVSLSNGSLAVGHKWNQPPELDRFARGMAVPGPEPTSLPLNEERIGRAYDWQTKAQGMEGYYYNYDFENTPIGYGRFRVSKPLDTPIGPITFPLEGEPLIVNLCCPDRTVALTAANMSSIDPARIQGVTYPPTMKWLENLNAKKAAQFFNSTNGTLNGTLNLSNVTTVDYTGTWPAIHGVIYPKGDENLTMGPFKLDYMTKTVKLIDMNLVISSTKNRPGSGDLVVGPGQYFAGATNSFIAGKHNRAGGEGIVVAGLDNQALGVGSVVVGGTLNVAAGNRTAVLGGINNNATGENTVIQGGAWNKAGGDLTAVIGGQDNSATKNLSTVGGGYRNKASGKYSVVNGGEKNQASGFGSVVDSGYMNKATGTGAAVLGGEDNTARGMFATIVSGKSNFVKGQYATIAGGEANMAEGKYAVVVSGKKNQAKGDWSEVASGVWNNATGSLSTVVGGLQNDVLGKVSTIAGAWTSKVHKKASESLILGGSSDKENGVYSAAFGGMKNEPFGLYAAITGGEYNYANGVGSAISSGQDNEATGMYSSISAGSSNRAYGTGSSVSGGNHNNATGPMAAVSGGVRGLASGEASSVSGGEMNKALGKFAETSGGRLNKAGTVPKISKATIKCSFTIDNFVSAVYYNDVDITTKVKGDLKKKDKEKVVTLPKQIPGAYLVITGHALKKGDGCKVAGFAISCSTGLNSANSAWQSYASSAPPDILHKQGGGIGWATPCVAANSGFKLPSAPQTKKLWGTKHKYASFRIQPTSSATGWYDTAIGGHKNQARGNFATIGGGDRAVARGERSLIVEGEYNTIGTKGLAAVVIGGKYNKANGHADSIIGGAYNAVSGYGTSISGGYKNIASGWGSSVSGGMHNKATEWVDTVTGGGWNQASGNGATVSGGYGNLADNVAVVAGGKNNTAKGYLATILGGEQGGTGNNTGGLEAGGYKNSDQANYGVTIGGNANIDSGGWGTTVLGGSGNKVMNSYASSFGGYQNIVNGTLATAQGGRADKLTGQYSSASGGAWSKALGFASLVTGGSLDEAHGMYSKASGGVKNNATGLASSADGGHSNTASGRSSVAAGGFKNEATGDYSANFGGTYNKATGTYSYTGGGGSNVASGMYATAMGYFNNNAAGMYDAELGDRRRRRYSCDKIGTCHRRRLIDRTGKPRTGKETAKGGACVGLGVWPYCLASRRRVIYKDGTGAVGWWDGTKGHLMNIDGPA